MAKARIPLHIRPIASMLGSDPRTHQAGAKRSFRGGTVNNTTCPADCTDLASATKALNAWLEIDLDALDHNVGQLRALLGPGVELIAVVKANAYGAGVEGIAPALGAAGVDRFATVWVREAVELRRSGVTRPILVLGHAFPEDAAAAIRDELTLTVHSRELAEALDREARAAGTVATVNIHVDTGLRREGLVPQEAVALAHHIEGLSAVRVAALSTHMANADEADDSYSDVQEAAFAEVLKELPGVALVHTANTATAARRPESRHRGVRIGLALHGAQPENTPPLQLRPVLSLKARVARVVDVAKGEGVSYGLTWRASGPGTCALVPVGYGDGWRRTLGNRGAVLIGGERRPIRGRVCMDQFLADVTGDATVAEGDEVVLIGAQGSGRITVEEVADQAGTIPWDVLASLQARLPRVFHRGGVVTRIAG